MDMANSTRTLETQQTNDQTKIQNKLKKSNKRRERKKKILIKLLQRYLRRAKKLNEMQRDTSQAQEDVVPKPVCFISTLSWHEEKTVDQKYSLSDARGKQEPARKEKEEQGFLGNDCTLLSKTCTDDTVSVGKRKKSKKKQVKSSGSKKEMNGAQDENGSRNEGEVGQNRPEKKKKKKKRWLECTESIEEGEDAGGRPWVEESSEDVMMEKKWVEEEEKEATVEDSGMMVISGGGVPEKKEKKKKIKKVKGEIVEGVVSEGGVDTRDVGVPENEAKKKKVKEEKVELVVSEGDVETRDVGVPENEGKKKKVKTKVKEEKVEVSEGDVETRDVGVPENEGKKKKRKSQVKEEKVEVVVSEGDVETRDVGVPEKEVKKKKIKTKAKEKVIEMKSSKEGVEMRVRSDHEKKETSKKVREEVTEGMVNKSKGGKRKKTMNQGAAEVKDPADTGVEVDGETPPTEVKRKRRQNELSAQDLEVEKGEVPGETRDEHEKEKSKVRRDETNERGGSTLKKKTKAAGKIREEKNGVGKEKKEKKKRESMEDKGEGVEDLELNTALQTKKKKKKRKILEAEGEGSPREVDGEPEEGGLKKKMKKKRDALEDSAGLGEAENEGNKWKVKERKKNVDDMPTVRMVKVKHEKQTEEGNTVNNGPTDIIFLSARPGNRDEVSIDQARRLALQREIDEESQPKSNVGQWETAHFDNSERQMKFLRLMGGLKKGNQPTGQNSGHVNMALGKESQQNLQQGLLGEFERAHGRHMDFQNKGAGLGFTAPSNKKFAIDINARNSVRFDD
ncbi:uncharacterized protein knop1 [Brachyhypopomus gauderio]|uniref:uncharacterized protein knop1 n=1 Tax=Brachyhypopomus gauderio TaxID=698409 RepID=UPI0040425F22